MQRQEIPNNTDEQVREYVTKAVALADELRCAPDDWSAIFRAAYDGFAGKQIVMVQAQPVDLATLAAIRGRH
jgi:hypothetical protein